MAGSSLHWRPSIHCPCVRREKSQDAHPGRRSCFSGWFGITHGYCDAGGSNSNHGFRRCIPVYLRTLRITPTQASCLRLHPSSLESVVRQTNHRRGVLYLAEIKPLPHGHHDLNDLLVFSPCPWAAMNHREQSSLRPTDGIQNRLCTTYPTSSSTCTQTVYAQALLSAGNGIPLSDPAYRTLSDTPGVVIGDVGWVGHEGRFWTFLNIFRSTPSGGSLPKNFKPVEKPLSEWNVRRTPGFFPPGTILTSNGIEVASEPGSSVVDVNTKVPHGAVLCLPDGAERVDLVDVDALRSYVAEHALDWYRYINGYSGEGNIFNHPNGTLFLVTGADSASRWSAVAVDRGQAPRGVGRYNKDENVWQKFSHNIANAMTSRVGSDNPRRLGICFVRGFAIGLGSALWTHYSPRPNPADVEGAFALRLAPTFSLNTRSDPRRAWYSSVAKWLPVRKGNRSVECKERNPVNVLALILQVMLAKAPSADVLMVHDSIFKGTEEFDFYYPGVFDKLTIIFRRYKVVIEDGLAWMTPIPPLAVEVQDTVSPSSSFWRIVNPFSHQSSRNCDPSRDDLWRLIRRGHNIPHAKS